MCFCFTSSGNCHFSTDRKTTSHQKRVLDFLREKDTFRKTMELVNNFVQKKLQQQRQTLEIVEDFAWKSSEISHFLEDYCFSCFSFSFLDFFIFSFFVFFSFVDCFSKFLFSFVFPFLLGIHEYFTPLTLSTTALTVYLITNISDNPTTDNITLPF